MNRHARSFPAIVVLLFTLALPVEAQEVKRITILYDAFGPPSALVKDWGFAAFVEYGGKRILFDTGNNTKIFEHNVTTRSRSNALLQGIARASSDSRYFSTASMTVSIVQGSVPLLHSLKALSKSGGS